jgi:hypothetical protein
MTGTNKKNTLPPAALKSPAKRARKRRQGEGRLQRPAGDDQPGRDRQAQG